MHRNKTITVTILFADIKGYSSLNLKQKLAIHEDVEPEALKAIVEEVGRKSITHYNSWGDAYLLLFTSVEAGIKAALTLRDKFRSRANWTELGLPSSLNIRCSLHVGDVVIKDFENPIFGEKKQDVVGKNVDLTARIEPVTPPGRIWATEQIVSLLTDNSPDGISFDPIGKRELAKRWGIRDLYDIRRDIDKKINVVDIPKLDSTTRIIQAREIISLRNPPRSLVILCGPSAVGKDAIASRMRGRLDQLGIEARFPRKSTTRPKRYQEDAPIEGRWFEPSSQYEYLSKEEFNTRKNIRGKYEKYDYLYGFQEEDLRNNSIGNRFLICIYGDIQSLPEFAKIVENDYNRIVSTVLIQASEEELRTRLDARPGMLSEVIEIRKKEMLRDVARVQRVNFGADHITIENSNIDNPDDVTEKLLRTLLSKIGYMKKDE